MTRLFTLFLSLVLWGPLAPNACTSVSAQTFDTVMHLGREHIEITTKAATYLYDPIAGGFSSIIDPAGNDWVAYKDKPWGEYPASAASSYRGLPNLVFGGDDDGAGHPGHDKTTSKVVGKAIETVTTSGEWAWTWTFDKRGAKLEVTKAPAGRAYWFLYEGPAGGNYEPKTTFWATDLTEPSYDIPDHYLGGIHRAYYQTMYFGTRGGKYIIAMHQLAPDTHRDHISYLGNEEIGAENSPDGMVVAGFGRDEGATPLLTGAQAFYVAILPQKKVARVRRRIVKLANK